MKCSRTKREFLSNSSNKSTLQLALKCFCLWCCSFSQVSPAVKTLTGISATTRSTWSKTPTPQINPELTRRLGWLLLQDLLANLALSAKWILLELMAPSKRSILIRNRRKSYFLWLLIENPLNLEQTMDLHQMKRQLRAPKTFLSQTLSQTNCLRSIKSSEQKSLMLWLSQVRIKFPQQMLSDFQTQYQKVLLWSFQQTQTHLLNKWLLRLLSI
jgi:hypothetical protein